MELREWVTLAIAVLGAALGVFNTVTHFRRQRPRLSAYVKFMGPRDRPESARLQVVNTGHVPVTVMEIFLICEPPLQKREPLLQHVTQNPRFPQKLNPGQSREYFSDTVSAEHHAPLMRGFRRIAVEIAGRGTVKLRCKIVPD